MIIRNIIHLYSVLPFVLVEYADYDVIVRTHLFALFDGHFSTFSIWNFPELNQIIDQPLYDAQLHNFAK